MVEEFKEQREKDEERYKKLIEDLATKNSELREELKKKKMNEKRKMMNGKHYSEITNNRFDRVLKAYRRILNDCAHRNL